MLLPDDTGMRVRLNKHTNLYSKVSYYRQSLAEISLTLLFGLESLIAHNDFGGRYQYLSFERVAVCHTTVFCNPVGYRSTFVTD